LAAIWALRDELLWLVICPKLCGTEMFDHPALERVNRGLWPRGEEESVERGNERPGEVVRVNCRKTVSGPRSCNGDAVRREGGRNGQAFSPTGFFAATRLVSI
jgi:hypothetical protein